MMDVSYTHLLSKGWNKLKLKLKSLKAWTFSNTAVQSSNFTSCTY